MLISKKLLMTAAILVTSSAVFAQAPDKDLVPSQFSKQQRENLQRFLQEHEKPDHFIPPDAKVIGSQDSNVDLGGDKAQGKPIKQYLAQIIPHRPVPGQEEINRADVYYYRPNPEKGKPGITIRHTVDVTTGKQVGPTEILLDSHAPISREELAEAVDLAREKSAAVSELYKDRDKSTVHWEYLQLMINRKHGLNEPGDRVVRLLFVAGPRKDQVEPTPVPVILNLTKGIVSSEK
jgi:hypothetical protein